MKIHDFTIASGETDSDIISITPGLIGRIFLPTLTGTELSFKGGYTEASIAPLADQFNTPVKITSADGVNKTRSVNPFDFAGLKYLQIISNAAEGSERVIKVQISL